ncbi:phosrestin-2-like [Arctopsyche grandis]|uniref:phosrestin-2-like n=1 Tax=Arctopsyche grandis TaxID=121162 RepID=UPI00406D9F82
MAAPDTLNCQRVFKKSSPNNKLTLYLCSRDLVIENGVIDKLYGVLCVDQDLSESKKVFGQVTLTFRYGREDEEVMGLKFCNEAVMSLAQLYPPLPTPARCEPNTPLQEALLQRLGSKAHAFSLELTPMAPPSVQLVPAKEYRGAPIGTSYDVRAYIAEDTEAKLEKRTSVRMGIRVVQGGGVVGHIGHGTTMDTLTTYTQSSLNLTPSRDSRLLRLSPKSFKNVSSPCRRGSPLLRPPVLPEETTTSGEDSVQESSLSISGQQSDEKTIQTVIIPPVPHAIVNKPFLLSDGKVALEASLDKASYSHGEPVKVTVAVNNSSHKTVRRIKVFVVQHVDVCMFSNGKFKNVVALTTSRDECPVSPGGTLNSSYILRPARGTTKNWIALEDSYSKNGASLASTVICNSNSQEDRNVFAIYVSYYVKVKLSLSAMGGELSLKLPFVLAHSCREEDLISPSANIPTDDIAESADLVLKSSNGKKSDLIKYESKDVSSPKDLEDLNMGNVPFNDAENADTAKIIVNIEDHTTKDLGTCSLSDQRRKSDTSTKKTHTEDDLNLITNYESDST